MQFASDKFEEILRFGCLQPEASVVARAHHLRSECLDLSDGFAMGLAPPRSVPALQVVENPHTSQLVQLLLISSPSVPSIANNEFPRRMHCKVVQRPQVQGVQGIDDHRAERHTNGFIEDRVPMVSARH